MEAAKTAIVTGAGSGLGRAIAVELARHGYRIAIADINETSSRETLALVEAAGGQGQVEPLDVADPQAWQRLGERLRAIWPQLDLLVNNAGVAVGGDFERCSLNDWRWIVEINLLGAIYGTHALVDWLKRNPAGAHIVNIASLAAIASLPGMAPYNVTKAGVVSLSETFYGELKPHRIGVTCVCPAFVPTNIMNAGRFPDVQARVVGDRMLAESRVTPEDVARRVRRAIERRELYVFIPRFAGIVWRLKRLMPRGLLNFMARMRARELKKQTDVKS